jgi:hypothetical protein
MNASSKIGLSVVEAGWLLQRPEGQIRGMLRRGELAYSVEGRKIDPASVRARIGSAYASLLLNLALGGQFKVPLPEYRGGPPAPLYPDTLGLALQTGYYLPEDEICSVLDELALTLGPELIGCGDDHPRQRTQRSLDADYPFAIAEFMAKIAR